MKLLLLFSLLATEPALWNQDPLLRSPATVVQTTPVLSTDFSGPTALANITVPAKGAEVVMQGENACLQLLSESRDGISLWVQLPAEAARHYITVKGRARSDGEPLSLDFGTVAGTRSVAAAPGWARWTVPAPQDWAAFEATRRLSLGADSLVIRLPGKQGPVFLDDLAISYQTRVRDQTVADRAEWSGNLIANGGFEAGEVGYQVITTHPTIKRDEPPLPALLRVTGSEPNEGTRCAQIFVVDGPTILTPEPVVLQPGRKYTFSFDARARTTSVARLGVRFERSDGLEAADKEVALTGSWRRIKQSFETDQLGPAVWQARIEGFPIDTPYALELDGICLTEGDNADYQGSGRAVLSLDDGLSQPFGMGQVLKPTETLALKARLTAGTQAVEAEIHGELISALGAANVELPVKKVAADAGATVETELYKGTLTPGWYRCRAWLQSGELRYALTERAVACLVPPPDDDGWKMAVRWTTPDGLFRGRARRTMLSRLLPYGLGVRWLGPNAVALWKTLEPQPGLIETAALAAMIDDAASAKLQTVVELNSFPLAANAPEWLIARTSRQPAGWLRLTDDIWKRHVEGVVGGVKAEQVGWALAEPPEGADPAPLQATLQSVLATKAPQAIVVAPGDYHELQPVMVGPLDPTELEVAESAEETDPFAAEASRVRALVAAAADGSRAFLWPNQGLFPSSNGAHRTPGMTDSAGGPRPIVAAWSTLRHVIGDRQPTATADAGPVHAAAFGGSAQVVVAWSDAATVKVKAALQSAPSAVLATGEAIALPAEADGVTIPVGAWPIYLTDLDAASAAAILGAITAQP